MHIYRPSKTERYAIMYIIFGESPGKVPLKWGSFGYCMS